MTPIVITRGITIRPILVADKLNSDGLTPIKICITVDGKRHYKTTGHRIKPDFWDAANLEIDKKCPNHIHIRADVQRQIEKYVKEMHRQNSISDTPVTIAKVIDALKPPKTTNQNFYHYATDLIEDLRKDFSHETMVNYDNEINRLFGENGYANKNLTFPEMDTIWLRKYKSWLQGANFKTKTKHLSNNTIHKTFKILKKIFNKAIEDKVTTYYPFKDYSENPKYIQTDRTWLTEQEVQEIENVLLKPIPDYLERTIYYFLLGCYSGLRYSDWVRFNYDGFVIRGLNKLRLITRAKKNGEVVSMEIHSRLERVLEKLKTMPPVDCEQDVNKYLKGIGKLAGIEKVLTTHVGRFSFAVRCAELGISKETTANLMGITTKTCSIYYQITDRKMDSEFAVWDKRPEKQSEKLVAV